MTSHLNSNATFINIWDRLIWWRSPNLTKSSTDGCTVHVTDPWYLWLGKCFDHPNKHEMQKCLYYIKTISQCHFYIIMTSKLCCIKAGVFCRCGNWFEWCRKNCVRHTRLLSFAKPPPRIVTGGGGVANDWKWLWVRSSKLSINFDQSALNRLDRRQVCGKLEPFIMVHSWLVLMSILACSPREPHALAWGPSSSHTKIFRVQRTRLKTGDKITDSL